MNMKIKNSKLTVVASIALLLAMSGCASKPTLRSDYDDSVDFGQYKTYNYYENSKPNNTDYQDLFTGYMIKAIDIEMQARGYTMSDTPDLLVNFHGNLEDKTKVTSSPSMSMSGGYYGYRRGGYDPWMGYGYGTETHVSQYTEGTFNIDLIDPKLKRLVWETVSVGRVDEDTFAEIEERVRVGVPRFFKLYPFVAGDGSARDAEY
jgi:hypothetical protein